MLFIFLAIFAFSASFLTWKTPVTEVNPNPEKGTPIAIEDFKEKTLFEQLNFQRVQQNYQTSYLDLIQKISETDTEKIDTRNARDIFRNYDLAKSEYKSSRSKIDEYEKDFRVKCFGRMRSLIVAVLFYDRKTGKRMTRFNAQQLIETGALQEIPACPRGGTYSIIYKDGRRLFHCSVHGILRN